MVVILISFKYSVISIRPSIPVEDKCISSARESGGSPLTIPIAVLRTWKPILDSAKKKLMYSKMNVSTSLNN